MAQKPFIGLQGMPSGVGSKVLTPYKLRPADAEFTRVKLRRQWLVVKSILIERLPSPNNRCLEER